MNLFQELFWVFEKFPYLENCFANVFRGSARPFDACLYPGVGAGFEKWHLGFAEQIVKCPYQRDFLAKFSVECLRASRKRRDRQRPLSEPTLG